MTFEKWCIEKFLDSCDDVLWELEIPTLEIAKRVVEELSKRNKKRTYYIMKWKDVDFFAISDEEEYDYENGNEMMEHFYKFKNGDFIQIK